MHVRTDTHTLALLLGISVVSSSLRTHLSLAVCPLGDSEAWGNRRFPEMQDQVSGPDVEREGHVSGSHLCGEGWSPGGKGGLGGRRQRWR